MDVERTATEQQWLAAHPEGEVRRLDTAELDRLADELSAAPLFVPARLLVVRDASRVLESRPEASRAANAFLALLGNSWDRRTTLLLCAACRCEPKGPVAEYVRAHGELRWLPLPEPPKPWEDVRLTEEQRRVLRGLLQRTVPHILPHSELVEVLVAHWGFKPRQLVQTAERLLLAGQLDPEQLRAQLEPGEQSLAELEKAFLARDLPRLARLFAALRCGGELLGKGGERISPGGVVLVLNGWLQKLLRGALAMHAHARACGLAGQLDAGRCAASEWYRTVFLKRVHPLLERDIAAQGDTDLAKATPWQRHLAFRLAAWCSEERLRAALATLARWLPEREREDTGGLGMLAAVLLDLVMAGSTGAGTVDDG